MRALEVSSRFSAPSGDYRVIYEFNREEEIIFIDRIRHRREVYN
jgi:mRNA interferase RelE/StbE